MIHSPSRVRVAALAVVFAFSACKKHDDPQKATEAQATASNKEGGTGTRAKGEEGSMGNPNRDANRRYGVRGPSDNPQTLRAEALREAQEFGMIGIIGTGSGGGGSEAKSAPFESARAKKLDPNARYASTYRPGAGMLAAFDAAVARGSLPPAYRELVADFGSRYAPAMESPRGKALSVMVEAERTAPSPSGGPMHLRVALRSSDEATARARLSVHLVIDVSGSMSGAPLDNAKRAAKSLVDRLEPTDIVSITTFSDAGKVIVGAGPAGPRRAAIHESIARVASEGGTNIQSGLDLGYAEAKRAEAPDAAAVVMLLSDGLANGGISSEQLAERGAAALAKGIQTSTFGVGDSFDAALLAALADRGSGGYYYLKDSTQIAGALSAELDARLVPVAQAVEVRIRLKPDVAPLRVYGSRVLSGYEAEAVRAQEIAVDVNTAKKTGVARDRQADTEGGMRFFMPTFARADRHATLLKVALPAGIGDRVVGSVEVRYKDLVRKKNVTEEIPLKLTYAASDAESAKTINPSVSAAILAFAAGDALLAASETGDRERTAATLRERAELLKSGAATLHEPRLLEDATRVARLASIVSGETKIDPVPLAILLRGSAYGYLR